MGGQRRGPVSRHLAWAERRRLAQAEQRTTGRSRDWGAGCRTGPRRSGAGHAACSRGGAAQAAAAGEPATAAHMHCRPGPSQVQAGGQQAKRLWRGCSADCTGDLLQVPRTATHISRHRQQRLALASGLKWQVGPKGLPAQCLAHGLEGPGTQ